MEDEDKMPYQVKSTPFFRRMVSISKKNGQLLRLKEEYERMKEFNDGIDDVPSGAAVGGTFSRMELERKERYDKRISYGNNRSRLNIQKLTTNQCKPVGKPELATERELKELKEKLKNRLSFANSCSSRNLAKRVKKNDFQKSSNGNLESKNTNTSDALVKPQEDLWVLMKGFRNDILGGSSLNTHLAKIHKWP